MPTGYPNTAVDFWSLVDVRGPNECWPWLGNLTNGYGDWTLGGVSRRAHAWAHELAIGPVPIGANGRRFDVDHLCHTAACTVPHFECPHRACCNPAHLEAVPHSENVRRGNAKGQALTAANKSRGANTTHCPAGHEYTEANTYVYTNRSGWVMRHCRTCNAIKANARYHARKTHQDCDTTI